MKTMARRKVSQNDYAKAWNDLCLVEEVLHGGRSDRTTDEILAIAEKAAEGHDKPGIVRMPSMAAVLSGMPPEVTK
jgi:hypothetical protein